VHALLDHRSLSLERAHGLVKVVNQVCVVLVCQECYKLLRELLINLCELGFNHLIVVLYAQQCLEYMVLMFIVIRVSSGFFKPVLEAQEALAQAIIEH
jgi:hypothetical protein